MRENNDREVCDPNRNYGSIPRGLSNEPCCERPEPCYSEEVEYPVREINITPVNYGFVVKVGCQTFAIETTETLIDKLAGYLKDPGTTEKKWHKEHKI